MDEPREVHLDVEYLPLELGRNAVWLLHGTAVLSEGLSARIGESLREVIESVGI